MGLDLTVTKTTEGEGWDLLDLLGRSMGRISENEPGTFVIEPAGGAIDTMKDVKVGPYDTLDQALAEIETKTRGTCRRA